MELTLLARAEDAINVHAAPVATPYIALSGDGETLGQERRDASGTVREISDKFGHNELKELYQLLNSATFQASLTNYNCGDPVPKLTFLVSLRPEAFATTRAVEIYHSPAFSPSGRTRCLLFGLGYLLDKAVARLDSNPKQEDTREPHCDCARREGKEEWVTFPGPDEILATAKVAAKVAARKAEEAEQEKEENLAVIHLDPAEVQIEPDHDSVHLVTHEELLGNLPSQTERQLLTIDSGFSHWAFVVKRGVKQLVVLDGVDGKTYDEIPDHQRLVFSADGKHFAYIARQGGKKLVVADGKEGKGYDDIEELFHPAFSPDGKRLAYIASKPALGFPPVRTFVVLDGQEQKGYELVEAILFSPGSKHLAYNAEQKWNRGSVVVLDEKEGKSYDQVVGKVFSPDGNRLAYVAFNRTKSNAETPGINFAVVDGKEGKGYKSVSTLRFSPDSQHLAYVAGEGSSGTGVLVRDGLERRYARVELGPFSPDSQHLTSVARFGTNWLVLIDGKKLEPQARLATRERVWSPVKHLTYSPNSRHLAYLDWGAGTNCLVVLDGKTIRTCEKSVVPPVFSPDSQWLAYVIEQGGKSVPVLGGQEGKEYDQFLTCRAGSEDGARIAGLVFDKRGVLHAMAIRGGKILRLELELVKN